MAGNFNQLTVTPEFINFTVVPWKCTHDDFATSAQQANGHIQIGIVAPWGTNGCLQRASAYGTDQSF